MDLNLSLNEVAATAKKAARGAGYSWGMAEEAAAAVRWLAACGTEALTTDGTRLGGTSLPERGDVDISFGGALETPRAPMSRATPAPEVWAALNAFAERTYAPASEASRLMGAGAGTNDND